MPGQATVANSRKGSGWTGNRVQSPWEGWIDLPSTLIASAAEDREHIQARLHRPVSLAVGIFDGMHLGHQAVVESAVATARRNNGLSALLTFTPHPSRVLGLPEPTRLLMTDEWKNQRAAEMGLDAVFWKQFDQALARMEAEDFLPWLKRHIPRLSSIHVGANFHFGSQRRGEVRDLVATGKELTIDVFSVKRIEHNGEPISSSRIRQDLVSGRIRRANLMLGAPYRSEGVVIPGNRMGRRIGVPTLNLAWSPELLPQFGVYIVGVQNASGDVLSGVANFGLRPSVESDAGPLLEIHLLETCPYDVGDKLVVNWLDFLRPETHFSDLAALQSQIHRDVRLAREWWANYSLSGFALTVCQEKNQQS